MGDSYSTSRTFVFTIADQGDPASGMNTNAISGGPAMTYRVSDMSGTFSNNWSTEPLSPPSGMSRADCVEELRLEHDPPQPRPWHVIGVLRDGTGREHGGLDGQLRHEPDVELLRR